MEKESILDQLLDPLGRALTPEVAQRIVALRADAEVQRRIEDLADRNTEGLLSAEERSEYEALVAGIDIISILQAKARAPLRGSSAA